MTTRRSSRMFGWGIVVGTAVTCIACAVLAAGLLDPLDRYGQNLHFRHVGTIDAHPAIVMVDINDHALDRVHRWPWPRRLHADLISTLSELGAREIVMDLLFVDHAEPYVDRPDLDKHADIDPPGRVVGHTADAPIVYDDERLAVAMARAGNVFVAPLMFLERQHVDPASLIERSIAIMRGDPMVTFWVFRESLGQSGADLDRSFFQTVRIAALLERDFGQSQEEIVAALGGQDIEPYLTAAKALAARRKARRFLADDPSGTWEAFFAATCPDAPFDHRSRDRTDLLEAFRAERAVQIGLRREFAVPESLVGRIPYARDLKMPIDRIASAPRGVGTVTFDRDEFDGVLREVPIAVNVRGRVLWQLGLRAAADWLGLDLASAEWEDGRLVLRDGDLVRRIPMTAGGSLILNWHVSETPNRWQESFDHVPVTRVMEIPLNRRAAAANRTRLGLEIAEVVEAHLSDRAADYAGYEAAVRKRNDHVRALDLARTNAELSHLETAITELDQTISAIEREACAWVDYAWGLWQSAEPTDDAERAERDRLAQWHAGFVKGRRGEALSGFNDAIEKRNQHLIAELKTRIQGKICFVGYTATAQADLVTTPVYNAMPGVMGHATVANMLLQDRFTILAPRSVNFLVMALAGLVVTFVSATRGPWFSLGGLAGALLLLAAIGAIAFHQRDYHIATMPVGAGLCVVWSAVTLYRQLTEERAKRHLRRALAQYTAPAVAARIAQRTSVADLAPCAATVSCFFCDLAGFTALSERLGPERTRQVLNPYLRVVSDALIAHEGMVNKFVGDGIFAFFNAPISPCSDHAEAACGAALTALAAVRDLGKPDGSGTPRERLHMRIGLSTGEAFVGDYGSETKLDYTCIGDTVNLGSRLEEANKAFGTRILLDEATGKMVDGRFALRPLGLVRITGKTEPVSVHELLGLAGQVESTTLEHARLFGLAIRHYQARDWDAAAAHLDTCRGLRPDDPVIALYEHAIALSRKTPAEQWSPAIRMNRH